jgi:hypothetical protein
MRVISSLFVFLSLLVGAACAHEGVRQAAAPGTCPNAVMGSIATAFPGATVTTCTAEQHQFEVGVDQGGEKVTVDVAPDGTIVQTEIVIAPDQVPATVIRAFASRYPGVKPTRVEKQVRAGKAVYYELAFPPASKVPEATFAEDGSFVDEE